MTAAPDEPGRMVDGLWRRQDGSLPSLERFPILPANPLAGDPQESLPWHVLEPHDFEAYRQQGAVFVTLALRGGLTWCELFAIVNRTPYRPMPEAEARMLCRMLLGLAA
jgi:hypothetical protein